MPYLLSGKVEIEEIPGTSGRKEFLRMTNTAQKRAAMAACAAHETALYETAFSTRMQKPLENFHDVSVD